MVASSALACSGGSDPVSIGSNEGKTGESLSDYSAFWDGYLEGGTFPSGSDRVRVQLDADGQGYLEVGDIPPLAPATDPEALYPNDGLSLGVDPDSLLHEGFRYTLRDAAVQEKRIRLSVATWELYTSWCELQTPHANPNPGNGMLDYSCSVLSNTAFTTADGTCYAGLPEQCLTCRPGDFQPGPDSIEVNCNQFHYCNASPNVNQPCACTADGCVSTDNPALALDAALEHDGAELTGTLTWNQNYSVRLTRH
jgi:hypothetical protein